MSNFESVYLEAEKALEFLKSEHHFVVSERKINDPDARTQFVGGQTKFIDDSTKDDLKRFFTLSTAPLRLEMDLDIGFNESGNKESYTIFELNLLESSSQFPARQHNLYDAIKGAQQLRAEFEILSNVLKQCGSRFFANDRSLWDDLKKQRASISQTHQDEKMHLDAEEAFKEKNWQKVIDLLKGNESRLGELDHTRLNYALKQMK